MTWRTKKLLSGSRLLACAPVALACSGAAAPASPSRGPAAAAAEAPIVSVESGQLSGSRGREPGVLVYKGVPFAAPPVGERRWRPPAPPLPWPGVRQAVEFSKSCVQPLRRSLLPWTEEYMLRNDVDEDCLALNVWAPASHAGPRPVLVFVHGGAFNSGSGEVAVYDGERLAQRGIIVVTINYRLGVLGFLCHPELSAESPRGSCGNYGLLDQIAALEWVQRNIAAFGGDPGNVTVAGQSAGAASVFFLTASPLARGLFHRAIAQSGPWDRRSLTPTRAEAEARGVELAASLGGGGVAGLRALPASALHERAGDAGRRLRPIVDGWVVPDQLSALLERGELAAVPLLTGLTADERSSQPDYGRLGLDKYERFVRDEYGPAADAVLARYPAATDAEAGAQHRRLLRDRGLASLIDWRRARRRQGAPADFGYLFERAIPWPEHPEYQAFHSSDLPYFFDNLAVLPRPWQDVDHALSRLASSFWLRFATSGDPNGPGLPEWPSAPDHVLRLGAQPSAEVPLDEEQERLLLETVEARRAR